MVSASQAYGDYQKHASSFCFLQQVQMIVSSFFFFYPNERMNHGSEVEAGNTVRNLDPSSTI